MAFANVSDIIATTIQKRSRKLADNVTNNNALLKTLSMKGKIKPASGGDVIMQELTFQENSNAGWYSGYDVLPVGVSDVISAAVYDWKQAAVPVVISGLEQLKNSGEERMIDLMEGRLSVAESTMSNLINAGLYSDGSDPNAIEGLQMAIPETPETAGFYGGIDDAWAFWHNAVGTYTDETDLLSEMNLLWANLIRGRDMPGLIMCDTTFWNTYIGILQDRQRFTSAETGAAGFPSIKYQTADVVLDGGIYFPSRATLGGDPATGGSQPGGTAYFLNTDYLHFRPHSQRNMVPLSPKRRYATNQDAEVQILAWAGNLTCSGRRMQGVLHT